MGVWEGVGALDMFLWKVIIHARTSESHVSQGVNGYVPFSVSRPEPSDHIFSIDANKVRSRPASHLNLSLASRRTCPWSKLTQGYYTLKTGHKIFRSRQFRTDLTCLGNIISFNRWRHAHLWLWMAQCCTVTDTISTRKVDELRMK